MNFETSYFSELIYVILFIAEKSNLPCSPEEMENEILEIDNPTSYVEWLEREGTLPEPGHREKMTRVVTAYQIRAILSKKPSFSDYIKEGNYLLMHIIFVILYYIDL